MLMKLALDSLVLSHINLSAYIHSHTHTRASKYVKVCVGWRGGNPVCLNSGEISEMIILGSSLTTFEVSLFFEIAETLANIIRNDYYYY